MLDIILSAILLIAIVVSIPFIIHKRRNHRITGFKTTITPICFYLIAFNHFIAIWIDILGLVTWLITIGLLIIAAYFTKFIPKEYYSK